MKKTWRSFTAVFPGIGHPHQPGRASGSLTNIQDPNAAHLVTSRVFSNTGEGSDIEGSWKAAIENGRPISGTLRGRFP